MLQEYPVVLLYFVLAVGTVLALFRPYKAFVFVCCGVSALNLDLANNTRTVLGPYFNLLDAFIFVMILALMVFLFATRQPLIIPRPFIWLVIVWSIGTVGGIWLLGWRYEAIRSCRWALNFPLALLVAANFVRNEKRSDDFVLALFFGALLGSIQHITTSLILFQSLRNYSAIRDIGFLFSPITPFLIAATNQSFFKGKREIFRYIWYVAISLFMLSLLLNQTRSTWISVTVASIILAVLLKHKGFIIHILYVAVPLLVVLFLIVPWVTPLNPTDIISARYNTLADESMREYTTKTRWADIEAETQAWLEGNWLFGRGFAYFYADRWVWSYDEKEVAWAHVGYVTYLAQLGLLGLIIYGFYVPLAGIRAGRGLYFQCSEGASRRLALLGLSCFIVNAVQFAMSSSYLQPQMVIPGLLLGAVIGRSRLRVNLPPVINRKPVKGNALWRTGLESQL